MENEMTLADFLECARKRLPFDTEEILRFMDAMSDRARRITCRLNASYHEPDGVRALLSELYDRPVPPSVRVFPPYYTDFGLNTHLGEGVFINACCHFQDHGGVWLGDGCQIGHSFSQTFGAHHHIPHGLGCAWGLPGVMVYTAQYGERSNLEEVADAMDVSYTAETDSMELAEQLAKRVTDLMRELGIKSLKDSGFTLEDCLASTEQFFHDGAFGNSPGTPGEKEIQEYITYTYHAY